MVAASFPNCTLIAVDVVPGGERPVTKLEVYHFLTFHCKAHLPPIRTVTSYFMRDLLSGKKKCKYPFQPSIPNLKLLDL